MSASPAVMPRFGGLPPAARAYVTAVVVAGALCLLESAKKLQFDQHGLFALLAAMGIATSAIKIDLPLGRSQSNLSLSHAVNFWALFALGPAPTVCIATVSAWAQCTLARRHAQPAASHRVQHRLADVTVVARRPAAALLVIGRRAPGVAALVARPPRSSRRSISSSTRRWSPARSRSRRGSRLSRVWQRNFLWSAPSYLAGAALAAVATAASARGWFGWLALLAVPLYLVFRSYHTVVARLREEQDQTRRAMDVQLATIEALALAIEAKAGCTPEHIRSIQQYAAMLAEAAGLSRRGGPGRAHRGAAARHRQHGGARAHPVEARRADARGVRARQDSSARRRRDSARTCRSARRSASSCSATTSDGTASAIRPGCAARTFRSARAFSRSPTATARCRPTGRIVRLAARRTRSRVLREYPARRSIRRSSTCSSHG